MSAALVASATDGTLYVSDEAKIMLNELTMPLKIVSVCGRYRSGKSTLLSQIIDNDTFKVGHSVNACSKGIGVAQIPSTDILMLDTEGLLSPDTSSTHDTRIFAIALLLSSKMIYNVTTTIDEAALSTLRVVVDFAKMMIQTDDNETASLDDLAEYMPNFSILVRDFSLNLVNVKGEAITPNQWFEGILSDDCFARENENASDKASVRGYLRRLFKNRDCLTLPHPGVEFVNPSSSRRRRKTVASDEFVTQIREMRRCIASSSHKAIKNVPVNGPGLIALVENLLANINSGKTPKVRDCWSLMAHMRTRDAKEAALRHMFQVTSTWGVTATPIAKLRHALGKVKEESVSMFEKMLPSDVAADAPDDDVELMRAELLASLTERCNEVIDGAMQHHQLIVQTFTVGKRADNERVVATLLTNNDDGDDGDDADADVIWRPLFDALEETLGAAASLIVDDEGLVAALNMSIAEALWAPLKTAVRGWSTSLSRRCVIASELESECESLKARLQNVTEMATEAASMAERRFATDLETIRGEMTVEREVFEGRIAALMAEVSSSAVELESTRVECEELRDGAAAAAADGSRAAETGRVEALEVEMEAMKQRNDQLMTELDQAHERYETKRQVMQTDVADLRAETKKKIQRVESEASLRVQASIADVEAATRRAEGAEKRVDKMENDVAQARACLAETKKDVEAHQAILTQQTEIMQRQIETQRQEFMQAAKAMEEGHKRELRQLESERATLQLKVVKLDAKSEAAQGSLKRMRENHDKIEAERGQMSAERHREYQRQIHATQLEVEKARDAAAQKTLENAKLREQHLTAMHELDLMNARQ